MLSLAVLGILAGGCGENCRKLIHTADFEVSQGNYPRAISLYEQAERSGGCADAAGKKATAKSLLRASGKTP